MKQAGCSTIGALLLTGALLSGPVIAATTYYGVVDDVAMKKGVIVVNDSSYRLSPNLRVHGLAGELTKNMKIAFLAQNPGTRSAMITEIWVLPDSFALPDQ